VVALRALQENAPDAAAFAKALGWKAAGAGKLHGSFTIAWWRS
jgi:hypothetical protein